MSQHDQISRGKQGEDYPQEKAEAQDASKVPWIGDTDTAAGETQGKAMEAGRYAAETGEKTKEKTKEMAEQARGTVGGILQKTGDAVANTLQSLKEKLTPGND